MSWIQVSVVDQLDKLGTMDKQCDGVTPGFYSIVVPITARGEESAIDPNLVFLITDARHVIFRPREARDLITAETETETEYAIARVAERIHFDSCFHRIVSGIAQLCRREDRVHRGRTSIADQHAVQGLEVGLDLRPGGPVIDAVGPICRLRQIGR